MTLQEAADNYRVAYALYTDAMEMWKFARERMTHAGERVDELKIELAVAHGELVDAAQDLPLPEPVEAP